MSGIDLLFCIIEVGKGVAWVFAIMALGSLLRAGAARLRFNSTININRR